MPPTAHTHSDVTRWISYCAAHISARPPHSPGRGTLMADVLRSASTFPAFRDALQIHMVEVSPALQHIQSKALGVPSDCTDATHTAVHALWHATLAEALQHSDNDVPLVAIGHEFLDALPVEVCVALTCDGDGAHTHTHTT